MTSEILPLIAALLIAVAALGLGAIKAEAAEAAPTSATQEQT